MTFIQQSIIIFLENGHIFDGKFHVSIFFSYFFYFILYSKMHSIYIRIQINHAAFICFQFIGARK
jgi:hypothetical protein